MKQYLKRIEWRLKLPRDIKKRVMADLSGSIQERLEAGQTHAEILAELGSPQKAAAELNEQMKEYAFRKSPWRFLFLILAGLSGAWLMWYSWVMSLFRGISFTEHSSLGIIGGADGPTAIFLTTQTTGVDWDIVLMVLLLLAGLLGYVLLSHLPGKK